MRRILGGQFLITTGSETPGIQAVRSETPGIQAMRGETPRIWAMRGVGRTATVGV